MNRRAPIAAVTSAALLCVAMSPALGSARADAVAYLVNVTVRPGFSFANTDAALAYGQGICGEVAQGRAYADVLGNVKSDFDNPDEYQASYLVVQAVNELCPSLIWQLRNSAARYRPPTT